MHFKSKSKRLNGNILEIKYKTISIINIIVGYTKPRPCILSDTGAGQHSQQRSEGGVQRDGGLQDAHPPQVHQGVLRWDSG